MKKTHLGDEISDDDDEEEEPMKPPIRRTSRRVGVAAESYDPEKESTMEKVVHPKTEEQRKRLVNATKNILLFRSLDKQQMEDVINAMFERKVDVGDAVITEGDDGDNFYVIESGQYDVLKNIDGKDQKVFFYNGEGSFGELALMYNTPRAATVKATTKGNVWAMRRAEFRSIVLHSAFKKRQMYEELLDKVPILKSLSPYERMNIADALKTQEFSDGDQIIKQGDEGNEMFFVEEGKVRVAMKASPTEEEKEIAQLEKGGYFGELALLTKHPRAASIYAVGSTKVAVLDVGSFERLLGPCTDVLRRNIDDYEDTLKKVFGATAKIPELRG